MCLHFFSVQCSIAPSNSSSKHRSTCILLNPCVMQVEGRTGDGQQSSASQQYDEEHIVRIQKRARGMNTRKRYAEMRDQGELPGQIRQQNHAATNARNTARGTAEGKSVAAVKSFHSGLGNGGKAPRRSVGFADDDDDEVDEDAALSTEKKSPKKASSMRKGTPPPKKILGLDTCGYDDGDNEIGGNGDIEWGDWTDEHKKAAVKIQSRARGMMVSDLEPKSSFF